MIEVFFEMVLCTCPTCTLFKSHLVHISERVWHTKVNLAVDGRPIISRLILIVGHFQLFASIFRYFVLVSPTLFATFNAFVADFGRGSDVSLLGRVNFSAIPVFILLSVHHYDVLVEILLISLDSGTVLGFARRAFYYFFGNRLALIPGVAMAAVFLF